MIVYLSIKDIILSFSIYFVCKLTIMMHLCGTFSPTKTWPTSTIFGASKSYRYLPNACGSLFLRPVHLSTGIVIKSSYVSLISDDIFSKMSFCKLKL